MVDMKMPSYLQEIFRSDETVHMVFNEEKPMIKCEEIIESETIESPKCDEIDLTGNPLELDLKDNDLCDISVSMVSKMEPNWSPEENRHYPIDLNSARKCLNTVNMNYDCNEDHKLEPVVYCICDGKNQQKILVLGTNPKTFTRTRVLFTGCFLQTENIISINHMIEKHYLNCDYKTKVNTNIKALYSVVGWKIAEHNWQKSKNSCSALIEGTWNEKMYEPLGVNSASLIMQVIVGHEKSPLNVNWEQLKLLNHFKCILEENNDLEEEMVSCDPSDLMDILSSITEMTMEMQQFRKKSSNKDKKENHELSLVREKDFLDKLWDNLVVCKDVGTLKICFKNIFEEFANNTFIKLKVLKDNDTSIATILLGLLEGKLAVPNISCAEALQMLVELGSEKLKNDYLHLISSAQHSNVSKEIAKKWMEFNDRQDSKMRMTTANPKGMVSRITKMTLHKDTYHKNIPNLTKKLNYLSNLHLIAEFLYVAKACNLPDQTSDIIKSVHEKYLHTKSSTLESLLDCGLRECRVNLHRISSSLFVKDKIIYWNMRLESEFGNSKTVTIFHHTRNPVFPTAIFDDYDIVTASKDDDLVYVVEAIIDIN